MAKRESEKSETKAQFKHRISQLRDKTHRKVDYHAQKAYIDAADFYHLVREFFLNLLEKEYEPTYEELIHDVDGLEHEFLAFSQDARQRATAFLKYLSELEYLGKEISQDEAHDILQKFRTLVVDLTNMNEKSIDMSIRKGLIYAKQDKEQAVKLYKEARKLYEQLGHEERQQYYEDLQKLYEAIQGMIFFLRY